MNANPDTSEGLYQSVFQHSAVSLWIQDIGELRKTIREWSEQGIGNIGAHLRAHLHELRRAVHSIKVVEVNDATLEMYEVSDKSILLGPLDRTLDLNDPLVAENMITDIVAIAENVQHLEKVSSAISPSGKRLDIQIEAYFPPAESTRPYMIVNVIDVTERRRLEREVERDRFLYHTLIDNLPDLLYLKDSDRRFLIANRAASDFMEVPGPESLLGRADEDFYPPETARIFADQERSLMASGKRLVTEDVVHTSTGKIRWILSTKAPIFDTDGKVSGLVGAAKDVTELRSIERALQKSEREYRSVFEHAPLGIFHSTQDGRLIDANPAFARSMGFGTSEELLSAVNRLGIGTLYADPSQRKGLVDQMRSTESWQPIRWRFRRRDGTVGIGRMVVRAYKLDDSSDAGFEAFMEDITEQEAARDSLAYERSLHTALMDNIQDRIFFKDLEGHFTLVNPSHAYALGEKSVETLVGKQDSDYLPREYCDAARQDELRVIASGAAVVEKMERIYEPGKPDVWLSTTRMILRGGTGKPVGTFGVSRDITAQRELQSRLIRSERLEGLGQLAAGIAHQFNNVNAAVFARLEAAMRHPNLPDSVLIHLQKIREGVTRSAEITARLDVLTIGAGSGTERANLDERIQSVLLHFQVAFEETGIAVHYEPRPAPPVHAPAPVVDHVVMSVLSNAIDALIGCDHPSITITTIHDGGDISIRISDNGAGVSEKDLPKLFTPFYTTKGEWANAGSSQTAAAGIGLSLAISHSLITELGGTIEIQSEEGTGTVVTITLPADPAQA
ncbi:MAG TPA: PAS domain-containing protein [Spirochaetia bacterium]|nr:PAS domain-containing protein [Spirochaetia bacterium]